MKDRLRSLRDLQLLRVVQALPGTGDCADQREDRRGERDGAKRLPASVLHHVFSGDAGDCEALHRSETVFTGFG